MIERWVAYWDQTEAPTSLAAVRIGIGLLVAIDLVQAPWFGVVELVWGGWTWWALSLGASLAMAAGLFSRASALVFAFAYAQLAWQAPLADRGIDMIFRNMALILAFSAAGQTWSLDCWRKTGAWADPTPAPSWPRLLMVVQLVAIYFLAGTTKFTSAWSLASGYSALWLILHDPMFSRFESLPDWAAPLTRAGTGLAVWWEMTFPLMYRGGRVKLGFIAGGVLFHLGLMATMRLGIFPFGMLALYPAFYAPAEWQRGWHGLCFWLGAGGPHADQRPVS